MIIIAILCTVQMVNMPANVQNVVENMFQKLDTATRVSCQVTVNTIISLRQDRVVLVMSLAN